MRLRSTIALAALLLASLVTLLGLQFGPHQRSVDEDRERPGEVVGLGGHALADLETGGGVDRPSRARAEVSMARGRTAVFGRVLHDCDRLVPGTVSVYVWRPGSEVYRLLRSGSPAPDGVRVAEVAPDGSYRLDVETDWGTVKVATVGGELYSEPVELQLTGESLELDLQAYAVYAVAYRVVDASTGGPPISGPGALIFGANSYRAEGASVDHLRRGAGRPIVEARCQEIERQLPDGVQVRFMLGSCGAPPKLIYSVHLLGYERARGALPMFPLENAAESIESVELRQEAASWGSVRLELEGEPLDPMGGTLSGENAVVYLTDARTRQQSMHVLRLTADAHELRVPESVYEVRVDSIHDVGRRDLPVSRAVFEVSAGESVDLDVSFAGFGHVRVVPDRELTKGEPFRVMLEDSEGSYATHRLEEGASMLYGVAPGEYSLHLLSVGGFSFQVDGSRSVPVVVRGDEVAIAVLPF